MKIYPYTGMKKEKSSLGERGPCNFRPPFPSWSLQPLLLRVLDTMFAPSTPSKQEYVHNKSLDAWKNWALRFQQKNQSKVN